MKRFAGSLLKSKSKKQFWKRKRRRKWRNSWTESLKDFIAGYWFAVRHERRNLPTSEDLDRIEREQSKRWLRLAPVERKTTTYRRSFAGYCD